MLEKENMYGEIPYVDRKVSRIFFGTAFSPVMMGGDGTEYFEAALRNGINAFDLARNYLYSERSFGNWLEKRGQREHVVILSKCGHPSSFGRKRVTEADMKKDLAKSLRELRTDHIDIYLLHRDDPDVDVQVPVEVFNEMHAQGKIGAFGGSNWKHTRIEEANEYAYKHNLIPFSVSSPNFGLARQITDPWGGGCETISGPENEEAREWYRKNQMPVIAYSSLGRGLLTGKLKSADAEHASDVLDAVAMKGYASPDNFERLRRCEILAKKHGVSVPQIAMNWIFTQGVNTFAVASMSSEKNMKSNVEALGLVLSKEETDYLNLQGEEC